MGRFLPKSSGILGYSVWCSAGKCNWLPVDPSNHEPFGVIGIWEHRKEQAYHTFFLGCQRRHGRMGTRGTGKKERYKSPANLRHKTFARVQYCKIQQLRVEASHLPQNHQHELDFLIDSSLYWRVFAMTRRRISSVCPLVVCTM